MRSLQQTGTEVWRGVLATVYSAAQDSVYGMVRSTVRDSVRAHVWGGVWVNVWDNVCSSARTAVAGTTNDILQE